MLDSNRQVFTMLARWESTKSDRKAPPGGPGEIRTGASALRGLRASGRLSAYDSVADPQAVYVITYYYLIIL